MKPILLTALFFAVVTTVKGQATNDLATPVSTGFSISNYKIPENKEIKISQEKWQLNSNHVVTGGLVFLAGIFKGFNETLQFHWKEFHRQFPKANPQWFYPAESWKNKYKNNDPNQGAKHFLSTSLLIAFTDQYHLNNFFSRLSWGSALVIKMGEGKKPFKQYLLDFLYYAVCHQAGFAASYYPFSKYRGK